MNLLAIDTSTTICTVAIKHNEFIFERTQAGSRMHSQTILPMIDACLHEAKLQLAELDACIFGQGPGSFTGLRLAAAIMQGFSIAHALKVVPVSSLLAYAQTVYLLKNFTNILVCEDARIQQVYWNHCQIINGIAEFTVIDQCTAPENLLNYVRSLPSEQSIALVGEGWNAYPALAKFAQTQALVFVETIAVGAGLLQLGSHYLLQNKTVSAELALPSYVQTLQYKKIQPET